MRLVLKQIHLFFFLPLLLLGVHSLLFPCPSPDKQVEDFLLWIRPKRLASAVRWCNCLKQILWTFPLAIFFPSIFALFIIIIINFAVSTMAPWRFGVINMLVTFHSNEFECNDTWISVGVTVFFSPSFSFLNYIKDVIYVQIIKSKKCIISVWKQRSRSITVHPNESVDRCFKGKTM